MDTRTYIPKVGTLKGTIFIIVLLLALCIGLVLASPVHGEGLSAGFKGDVTGAVTVNGQGVAGLNVELRQRTNGGSDTLLTTANTDATGTYHFTEQPSAPNDAFYYVRITGGKGPVAAMATMSVWYSFPIIYIAGSAVAYPRLIWRRTAVVLPPMRPLPCPRP